MVGKYLCTFVGIFFSEIIYASDDVGILEGLGSGALEKVRTGDIHSEDIPNILKWATDYLMGFAATISVIFIIIGTYKILLGSLDGERGEGKKTIKYALGGFVLASLAWVILKFVIDNFS